MAIESAPSFTVASREVSMTMDGLSLWHKLDSSPMFDLNPLIFTSSIVKSVSRSLWARGGQSVLILPFEAYFENL